MNITNINANSNVCLVENTRGFLLGCVMEKDIQKVTRVEFAKVNSLKNDIDYYENFNHPYFKNRKITHLTQKMILDKTCPISQALTKSMHRSHDSLLICHDQYKPLDIYVAVEALLAPNCFCAAFSIFMNPLVEL